MNLPLLFIPVFFQEILCLIGQASSGQSLYYRPRLIGCLSQLRKLPPGNVVFVQVGLDTLSFCPRPTSVTLGKRMFEAMSEGLEFLALVVSIGRKWDSLICYDIELIYVRILNYEHRAGLEDT